MIHTCTCKSMYTFLGYFIYGRTLYFYCFFSFLGIMEHVRPVLPFSFRWRVFSSRNKDRHTEFGTDIPCIWNKPRKLSKPSTVNHIDVRTFLTAIMPVEPNTSHYQPSVRAVFTHHQIDKRIYNIGKGNKSVFLHTLSDESENGIEEQIPLTIKQLAEKIKLENNNVEFLDLLTSYHNSNVIEKIEERTRGQVNNNDWFQYRTGRITASLFASVMHFKFGDDLDNYISKQILNSENTPIKSTSTEFGVTHESIARQL